ncbi:MAG: sulfite exporter TauE/SafE family protein [Sphingomonadales bacterium]|nr:sulfite exporter TauE/SafE family protein [Sphingomonadales bacterium]
MSVFTQFDGLHAVAGLLVGVLVGLTGVGGGSLMTPVLVLLFGVNPQTAVGTDLLYASLTKAVGTGVHGWRETVDWKIVRRLAGGSVPAAALTLMVLAHYGPVAKHTTSIILVVVAVMLFLTSISVFFRNNLIRWARRHHVEEARDVLWQTVLLGAVLGVAVTVSSVGAGAIGVTVLLVLYPQLPIARIVGSDIAHAVPLTLVSGLGHWLIGDINFTLLGNLLIGSIPGVIFGSLLSTRASDNWLRPVLACVLVISGWQLMVKATAPAKKATAAATTAPGAVDKAAGPH